MIAALIFLLGTAFPSASETAWMDPAAFHLELGMGRDEVIAQLKNDGWTTVPGKEPHHLIVQYEDAKTITLVFRGTNLEAARFELIGFIPAIRKAFEEQEQILAKRRREPTRRVARPQLLTWSDKEPHIDVVAATNRDSTLGQQGLGFLVVRYFVPPSK